jgi:hypothetical protein
MTGEQTIDAHHSGDHRALSGLTVELGFPPVLDACCGSRMFWFDRKDQRATFVDKRRERHTLPDISSKGGNRNWYIRVRSPSGLYAYDGYWTDSSHHSLDDAITEACTGACLWLPNTEAMRHAAKD